jgi:hypothetical protein
VKTQNLVKNGDAEAGLENWDKIQVQLVSENPHSGKNCFKTISNNTFSADLIPVNNATIYNISGWFKSADDKKTNVYLGFMPFTEDKKQIECVNINPVVGTETELVQECISEDTVLKVKDAGKWQIQPISKIAFNVDTSGEYKDLPNFNIYKGKILGAENKGTHWELKLEKPCGNSFPAKTKIREHRDGSTYIYAVNKLNFNTQTWQEFTGATRDYANFGNEAGKFWKGTKYVRIIILTLNGGNVYFDDIKLEEKK